MKSTDRLFLRDAAERIAVTALQAAAAVLIVDLEDGSIALDGLKVAVTAGVAAGLSVLKAATARFLGNRTSASLID